MILNISKFEFLKCFLFSLFLICKGCYFPSPLNGEWFQEGWPQTIKIEGSLFSSKGRCVASLQNLFLIEDSQMKCFRCIIIRERHPNVLQYRETFCDEESNLEHACQSLTVDLDVYTMIKVNSIPIPCPFKGPFSYNYNRGFGECRLPPSTLDICSSDTQLLFRFQACPDVMNSKSSEEELTCLAIWKDGATRYLMGEMKPKGNDSLAHGNETHYRCFAYEKDGDNYMIAQSGDASCYGLISPRDGFRTMQLKRTKYSMTKCQFPSWVTTTHRWHTLDGGMTYHFNHRNTSYRIMHNNASHIDVKVTCAHEVSSTPTSFTVTAYSMQGCSNRTACLTLRQRDEHTIEIQTVEFSGSSHDACSSPYNSNEIEYVTLIGQEDA